MTPLNFGNDIKAFYFVKGIRDVLDLEVILKTIAFIQDYNYIEKILDGDQIIILS